MRESQNGRGRMDKKRTYEKFHLGKMQGQGLPVSDIAEFMISATDIKHYIYCPRLIYFDHVLHAQPVLGSQQEESRELHEEYVRKELRRKDAVYYSPEFIGAEKYLFVQLVSQKFQLQGIIDCIVKTVKGEYVPIEYKNMNSDRGKVYMDHKYQLVAYALLIEENFDTVVKRGFVNYIPERLVLRFSITPTMKSYVKRVIGHIKRIIKEEKLPPIRVAKSKCQGGCGHKQICYTLWF
jgi:CRISPR-associated exonuclease Cas4